MDNLKRVTVISIFFLLFIVFYRPVGEQMPLQLPHWIQKLHHQLSEHFTHPQNAHFIFSVLTGEKKGLSPTLLKDLELLHLRFLLSPTGLHLTGYLFFLNRKKRLPLYLACFFLPAFYSLKRIALMRLLSVFNRRIKQINIFYLTFIISFLFGHFTKSPLSFTYSFLLIGTFFSLKYMSLLKMFLAISASHLLLAFFQGDNFSFLAMILSILLVQIFVIFLPLIIIFITTFYIYPSHWIEPLTRFFILLIHFCAKLTIGSFLTSSFMLLCIVWILLLKKRKRWLLVCLCLHAGLVHSPAIYVQASRPQVQLVSAGR